MSAFVTRRHREIVALCCGMLAAEAALTFLVSWSH